MSGQTTRAGGMIAIPAVVLAAWLTGASAVAWHSLGQMQNRITNRVVRLITGRGRPADNSGVADAGPGQMSDPRLTVLRGAAESWQRSSRSRREVVDQVCLVPDMATFFEAIAAWDERYFFPILIDEPAWTLPFLRAFRPARVVRYVGRPKPTASRHEPAAADARDGGEAVWKQAIEAVSRSWSGPSESHAGLPDPGLPPRELGITPPGMVLSAPQAPMLAGAVALAAGRFQPLVHLRGSGEPQGGMSESGPPLHFGDVLSLPEAWHLAQRVEQCVASVIPSYDRLGDDCDFLTIAADWPYRYSFDLGAGPFRGLYALDDLIGRRFEPPSQGNWMNQSRRRWAYTGRLLGDPAASVAGAMAALFLQPTSTLLWNTYGGGQPWSAYTMDPAARELGQVGASAAPVLHRTGRQSDLASWHRTVDPVNRFGMVLFNSAGGPDWFRISGGVGRPSDIPGGIPTAVAMIHSFSAADPTDPQTIAGRWLAQGAFSYFGSVNEPFVHAFRTPRLVAELMTAGMPFVAALRQGELETFGFPWRLVYLGDPLYHLENPAISPDRLTSNDAGHTLGRRRISPSDWCKTLRADTGWPVVEIACRRSGSRSPGRDRTFRSEEERFRWCLDSAIGELTGPRIPEHSTVDGAGAWLPVLREVRRDRLVPGLRPSFDALLIDSLAEVGVFEELMTRLTKIPVPERGPRVWQALETSAMTRLARSLEAGGTNAGFVRALDLWDEVIRLGWPKDSRFPAHFTERVAALGSADIERRRLWMGRLRRAGNTMAADPGRYAHAAVVAAERERLDAASAGPGAGR